MSSPHTPPNKAGNWAIRKGSLSLGSPKSNCTRLVVVVLLLFFFFFFVFFI